MLPFYLLQESNSQAGSPQKVVAKKNWKFYDRNPNKKALSDVEFVGLAEAWAHYCAVAKGFSFASRGFNYYTDILVAIKQISRLILLENKNLFLPKFCVALIFITLLEALIVRCLPFRALGRRILRSILFIFVFSTRLLYIRQAIHTSHTHIPGKFNFSKL